MFNQYYDDAKKMMHSTIQRFEEYLKSNHIGRASHLIFRNIHIDYYGVQTLIDNMVSYNNLDHKTIMMKPYDKSSLKDIERKILSCNLGVSVVNDGDSLRIVFPDVTEERRALFIKQVKHEAEQYRVAIRNIRKNSKNKFSSNKEFSKDDIAKFEKGIDKLTHEFVEQINQMLKQKEKGINEI